VHHHHHHHAGDVRFSLFTKMLRSFCFLGRVRRRLLSSFLRPPVAVVLLYCAVRSFPFSRCAPNNGKGCGGWRTATLLVRSLFGRWYVPKPNKWRCPVSIRLRLRAWDLFPPEIEDQDCGDVAFGSIKNGYALFRFPPGSHSHSTPPVWKKWFRRVCVRLNQSQVRRVVSYR
jgi:hypothetical protein